MRWARDARNRTYTIFHQGVFSTTGYKTYSPLSIRGRGDGLGVLEDPTSYLSTAFPSRPTNPTRVLQPAADPAVCH